jgi:hypothetical protein
MATAATIATVVSAGAGIVGAVQQARSAREARQEQQRAARIQNQQAALQRQRRIQQSLAQARVLRAQTQSAGFSAGAPSATGVTGAIGGIQSDVASNIGFSNVQFGLEQQRVGAIGAANAALNQPNPFATIAGVSGLFTNAASNRALQQGFTNVFG